MSVPDELVENVYGCVRCGKDESYQRPGRCIDEQCDGRMVFRRFVPESALVEARAQAERLTGEVDVLATELAEARTEANRLQAQAEALAEALEGIASLGPRPGYVEHAFEDAQREAVDALRAFRESKGTGDVR